MSSEFDIAIVGMSCRLPGARTLDEFWRNLAGGVESIARFTDEELRSAGVPEEFLRAPNYVKAAPILDEPGGFDAAFFGFSPAEARGLDPQQRILLELAHQALEHAGYDPERYRGRVGVFTGAALNTYFTNVGLHGRLVEDYIPTLIGNDKDFLSTRISYKLNLKGPSITVQTACSTSLVAVHLARQSLLSGESDMALAGAISVRVPQLAGYFSDPGGVVSPDGHVRAFSAQANGTVFGSGGGILVLKRFDDALADGDTICAVIKGSAVNNDGAEKAGYTAPSVNSQADAVVEALANAGLGADDISYVEAHGSGTPIGDPIEVQALTKAFRSGTRRAGYCAIGSVKTNVGHLDVAAGVAGVIKTVLALQHRLLPPSLHFGAPNPEIDFSRTPFYVNTQLREWASEGPRRAGVMSTGMGGTNAHVVLEEAPVPAPSAATASAHLFVLSAKTESALDHSQENLLECLRRDESVPLSDVAHTLQVGRRALARRRYLVCGDRSDALAALEKSAPKRVFSGHEDEARRPIVFLLPGIGDHYIGMAHGVYEKWPAFRDAVDRCAQLLAPHLGRDIRTVIYPASQSWRRQGAVNGIDLKQMLAVRTHAAPDPEAETLNRTLFAQPALFTIEYATACLWQSLGVKPDAMIGHSMGEYVAACLAGVMSLEDALRLIAARARLVDELPQGAMLAVTLAENEISPLLPPELSIALINGPSLCVVAGPAAAVAEFEKTLAARDVLYRRVQNGHAFHSKMLEPMAKAFERFVARVPLREPTIPYVSNVSGGWIAGRDAMSPIYWARHATQTARFNDAVQQLWGMGNPILLEVGPGRTLGLLAAQHPSRPANAVTTAISSIRHHYDQQPDSDYFLHAVGKLWLTGASIDWDKLHTSPRRRVVLPSYPFERQNYWLAPLPGQQAAVLPARAKSAIDDWFYALRWQRKALARAGELQDLAAGTLWLVVAGPAGGSERLRMLLQARQQQVCVARFGESFVVHNDGSFELDGTAVDDYVKLLSALRERAPQAIHIVHLAACGGASQPASVSADFAFFSLLFMAQAIGEANLAVPVKIGIVSNRLHEVTGEEALQPAMATMLGPCGVIPKELPNVQCFNVDLSDDRPVDNLTAEIMAALLSEFGQPPRGRVAAYRGRYRWERGYEKVQLPLAAAPPALNGGVDHRRLRRGGVYLLTGGTGGIGLSIGKYLAQVCQPTLVLTKQRPFPPKEQWQPLLNSDALRPADRKIIDALREIERLGAKVEVVVAEAADAAAMRRVINGIKDKHGALHGVIHGAGIVRAGLIQTKTKADAVAVLAPKVEGTRILFDLVKDDALDFLVLFSSITSVITPYAEADYAGANAYLDAFAHYANSKSKFPTLAINWPGWKEVGQLADLEVKAGLDGWKQAALDKAIATADGVEAFRRALAADLTQVVVSPEALQRAIDEAEQPFDHASYLAPSINNGKRRGAPANNATPKTALPESIEARVADIWQKVLGFEQIGSDDNFSQLGGHSLLAMQIVAQMQASFSVGFTVRDFFAAPSIAQASRLVRARLNGNGASARPEQPKPLVSPMGQRLWETSGSRRGFFFGPRERRLFGIHHPPSGTDERVLTVMCPPLLREYMRTHLALRELAISLTERGQHVLRFDFFGTGDSMGDLEDVSLTHWLEDIALALRQGRELSGCDRIRVLAVRASALLAGLSANACDRVERWVFWDPVADGASYLTGLRQIQTALAARDTSLTPLDLQQSLHEYAGYRLSPSLVDRLGSLDGSAYSNIPKQKLRVVKTRAEAGGSVAGVAPEVTPFACQWESDTEDLMMPKPVLERLIVCLS